MKKRIWLERRVEKNKEALLKTKLMLKKTAVHLAAFQRKRRTNLLPNYGGLFDKAGLADADAAEDAGEICFNEEVACSFLCGQKQFSYGKMM